jgi:hypothetical protein
LTICSTVFVAMGHAQASKLGMPELPVVAIVHPFGLRSRNEITDMADRCARDISALLSKRSGA